MRLQVCGRYVVVDYSFFCFRALVSLGKSKDYIWYMDASLIMKYFNILWNMWTFVNKNEHSTLVVYVVSLKVWKYRFVWIWSLKSWLCCLKSLNDKKIKHEIKKSKNVINMKG